MLVGHSLGGVVAWTVAQRHPDLIAAAFLEDPPLFFCDPAEAPNNARDPDVRAAARGHAGVARGGPVTGAGRRADRGRARRDQLAEGAAAARARNLLAMDMGVLDAAIDNSTLEDGDLDAPVGVPCSSSPATRLPAPPSMPATSSGWPPRTRTSDVVVVPGASHLIHDEARSRDTYVRELAAFVQRFD